MKAKYRQLVIMPAVGVALRGIYLAISLVSAAHAVDIRPELHIEAAEHVDASTKEMMLSATLAGKRIVAVGNRGVVLLSDDDGESFRQARVVPTNVSLTGVSFPTPNIGWAVGHWGSILRTTDGGETWALQRSDLGVDQPLFSVYFMNSTEGWAVGLWSLLLHTTDGGGSWSTVQLPPPPGAKKADRNLYDIFPDLKGHLFVACEQGRVLRSNDGGVTWSYIETGYTGSFWTGTVLHDGTLLVGGLRGSIYRSQDDGNTWTAAQNDTKISVTDLLQLADNSIVGAALDGVSLVSHDDGISFSGTQRKDRAALTAAVETVDGRPKFFSVAGPVSR